MPGPLGRLMSNLAVPLTDLIQRDTEAAETISDSVRTVEAATTGTAFTLTMGPPEVEPFLTKMIFMTARSATDDITVSGQGFTDIVLNLANEFTLLYSDGERWVEIGSNHS